VRVRLFVVYFLFLATVTGPGCAPLGDEEGAGRAPRAAGQPPSSRQPAPPLRPVVEPFVETPELVAGNGDAADDVALHPSGYVIGTNKDPHGGLEVYDADGDRRQWLPLGETNNVDLRGDLVVSSNRSRDSVDILAFERGRLRLLRSFPLQFDPYGICLYRDTVVVTASDQGRVEQYSLQGGFLRRLAGIETQSEGCVADDTRRVLYVAEEARGIWKFSADPNGDRNGMLIDAVDGHLAADVEGLTLVEGYLVASSQGDSTFAVYREGKFVGRFRVAGTRAVDEVTDTDGLDASLPLDLLVVHDHANPGGASSNYKFIELSDVFVSSSR
jgi:3-phytase